MLAEVERHIIAKDEDILLEHIAARIGAGTNSRRAIALLAQSVDNHRG